MQCSEHEKLYPLILAVVRHTSLHILSIFFAAHQTALRLRVVVENQCAFSASRDDVIAQLSGRIEQSFEWGQSPAITMVAC